MEERHVAYLSILTLCSLQQPIITTATRILVPGLFNTLGTRLVDKKTRSGYV